MADQSFPQIPTTVWWGVRQIMQRTPRAKLDDSMLAASLSVQLVAAKQYIVELRRVGLLDDEGKATDLANQWRLDDSYTAAVEQIASKTYPSSLVDIAPPGQANRQTVIRWFMTQGLGDGTARNKAATYLLVTSPTPSTSTSSGGRTESVEKAFSAQVERTTRSSSTKPASKKKDDRAPSPKITGEAASFPLNVNVQIHISADASNDQIEAIFSSMRKYLRDA